MNLKQIASILNTDNSYIPDTEIKWLLTDSRSLSFPADSLFFAIRTPRNDGHKYIAELYKQQVRFFVVNELLPEFKEMKDAVFLPVENTLTALQAVAAERRHKLTIPVIGITGSNGKTIIKEWLYQLLHTDYRIVRSPRSYNSQIGVPLSVWGLNENTELGLFEAGISEPEEMKRLQPIINPTIGIFTNLGDAHQENFLSLKQKAQEKLKLFTNAEVLIYCKDNKLLDITIAQEKLGADLISWGKSNDAIVRILHIEKTNGNTSLSLSYQGKNIDFTIPFTDEASIENAMHCITVLLYLGIDTKTIKERLLQLEPVGMRLEVKDGVRNCLIINDSYNSDLNSLNIALDFMKQLATDKNLSRTIILSDIMQSGFPAAELYQQVAELIKNKDIKRFIGIGKEISDHKDNFEASETYFFTDTNDFLRSGLIHQFRDELILLKGARTFHFEDISIQLESISHETVLEVNLNSLIDNLNYFRSKLRPETKMMSMVKAFAYGSGSVEVARTLQHHHCDYLAVAVADEGAELRREGIRIPIVVMNPEQGSFGMIFNHNLEPEIYSFRLLDAFIRHAEKLGITNYPVHVKIDSGMHRLGFEEKDIAALIERFQNQNQLKIRSVFSHLAGSDDPALDSFTEQQVATFTSCADQLSAAFPHKIMRHILNSSGIERFPQYQFDMVRLGIGHYGISALPQQPLKQVCSLKTIILQIKDIQPGETVGYNRKGKIDHQSRIAILPIGYADGLDRRLGNGLGEVVINGKRARLIGNICMDLCMVDVTEIDAREGDEAEIFGENISISELASKLQTIPYEILTSVSRRVKRVYFQE